MVTPGSELNISKDDILFDFYNNTISIKQFVFPKDWKGFEVKFLGIQRDGRPMKATEWKYWSLDRNYNENCIHQENY